jgi:hypothetical protein
LVLFFRQEKKVAYSPFLPEIRKGSFLVGWNNQNPFFPLLAREPSKGWEREGKGKENNTSYILKSKKMFD